jgi:hypothetical protein
MPAAPVPRSLAAWLGTDTPPLALAIVKRALIDVGICENPLNSNRSPRIDEYLSAVGTAPGQPWCAAAVSAWWREAGAETPPSLGASCDQWLKWATETRRWSNAPVPGAAVLYGKPGDASHIGVVVRTSPVVLSVEGNTSLAGYSREGIAVTLKAVAMDRVLGYVLPHPLA